MRVPVQRRKIGQLELSFLPQAPDHKQPELAVVQVKPHSGPASAGTQGSGRACRITVVATGEKARELFGSLDEQGALSLVRKLREG